MLRNILIVLFTLRLQYDFIIQYNENNEMDVRLREC